MGSLAGTLIFVTAVTAAVVLVQAVAKINVSGELEAPH